MRRPFRSRPGRFPITVVAVLAMTLTTPQPAGAQPAGQPAEARMASYLAGHPGGLPINANEIAYAGGAFVVTLTAPAAPAVADGAPDCPTGWFCFYEWANFGYPRGRLSDCGTQDLGEWYWRNRTESAQNKTAAAVQFYNGSVGSGQLLFTVNPSYTMSSVAPNQNRADYVRLICGGQ